MVTSQELGPDGRPIRRRPVWWSRASILPALTLLVVVGSILGMWIIRQPRTRPQPAPHPTMSAPLATPPSNALQLATSVPVGTVEHPDAATSDGATADPAEAQPADLSFFESIDCTAPRDENERAVCALQIVPLPGAAAAPPPHVVPPGAAPAGPEPRSELTERDESAPNVQQIELLGCRLTAQGARCGGGRP